MRISAWTQLVFLVGTVVVAAGIVFLAAHAPASRAGEPAGASSTSTATATATPSLALLADTATPSPTATPDADGDGIPDSTDNCPTWPNPGQALPPWSIPASDSDCDGYSATDFVIQRASEAFLGTDPSDKCADTATPFDERGPDFGEPLSPWPPDINDDGKTTLTDALRFGLHWNTVSGQDSNYSARFDLNGDDRVTLPDVLSLTPFFNQFCNAPIPPVTEGGYRMSDPIPNVFFDEMIGMALVPGQSDVAIVITRRGLLYRISVSGAFTPAPFGDISAMVTKSGDEGFLSIVFEPDDADHVYLNYTTGTEYYQPVVPTGTPSPTIPPDPKRNVISLFDVVDDELDLASERIIIEVLEPHQWHNVNEMVFGPDGMMYVGAGDGGGTHAEYDADRGQGIENLLATIFRIDPLPGGGYDIPEDNPFVGVPGAAEEVWAYGLRNPWRLSFDSQTGDLWTGDVGEFHWEEVDKVIRGRNYGWEIIEGEYNNPDGFFCHGSHVNCTPPPNYEDPRATYCHKHVTNCEFKDLDADTAIIGGYVYRGSEMPELYGWYIYADYGSSRIRAFDTSDDSSEPIVLAGSATAPCQECVRSFVQLADGELLVLTDQHGAPAAIYRLQRAP